MGGPSTPRIVSAASAGALSVSKRLSRVSMPSAASPALESRINFKVHGIDYTGKVAFAGLTEFAEGTWVGVVMDTRDGKHDGAVKGKRYFTCADGHGLFIRPQMLTKIFGAGESQDRDLTAYDGLSCISGRSDRSTTFCSTAQSELVDELRSEVSSSRCLQAEQQRKAEELDRRAEAIAKDAEIRLEESARASREACEEVRRLREEVEYERRCRHAAELEQRRIEEEQGTHQPPPRSWWEQFTSAFVLATCCSTPRSSQRLPATTRRPSTF